MPPIIFDIVIALVMAAVPLWLLRLRQRWTTVTEKGFAALGAWLLAGVWCVVAYGSFIEPRILTTEEYDVRIGDGGRALRVAVVSDTHLGVYKHGPWLARVVAAVNAAEPDLVLLAGDYASSAAGMREFGAFADIEARLGTYAALGNWDYRVGAVDVRRAIESHRVEVLTNESVLLTAGDARVRVYGLDDFEYGAPDWRVATAARDGSETVDIALAHNPDLVHGAEFNGMDLLIAGHTHGGQIRLPFIGAVPPLPTALGRAYDAGVFDVGATKLFITSGVGESGPRARLFDPPEVSIVNLTF